MRLYEEPLRKKIKTHPDAGLHALRHTFLTEAGEYTDPFTLQYVAGHDNIKTTMRYVHPREEAVEKLFVRLGDLERPEERVECTGSVQNPVQWDGPSDADIAKLAECEATEKTPEIACACPHTGCKGNPRRRRLDERKLGGAMLVVENDIQE